MSSSRAVQGENRHRNFFFVYSSTQPERLDMLDSLVISQGFGARCYTEKLPVENNITAVFQSLAVSNMATNNPPRQKKERGKGSLSTTFGLREVQRGAKKGLFFWTFPSIMVSPKV